MSWEGYEQVVCKKGHQCTQDAYDFDPDEFECPIVVRGEICGEKCAWWNQVDTTNGSYEMDERPGFEGREVRIDGYIELEIGLEEICGHCKSVLQTLYKIPPIGGHKVG
jgi:hypothetical protein